MISKTVCCLNLTQCVEFHCLRFVLCSADFLPLMDGWGCGQDLMVIWQLVTMRTRMKVYYIFEEECLVLYGRKLLRWLPEPGPGCSDGCSVSEIWRRFASTVMDSVTTLAVIWSQRETRSGMMKHYLQWMDVISSSKYFLEKLGNYGAK